MNTRSTVRTMPSLTRRISFGITEENAAWSLGDQDYFSEGSHTPPDASMLSGKVHYSQGILKNASNKNRLAITWMGHERAMGLLQYGQNNATAEDLAWALDPIPDVLRRTSLNSDASDLALEELAEAGKVELQPSQSSYELPMPNSETKRAVQKVTDAIRAANPPKPAVETEEAQLQALKAQVMANSRRKVGRWLANVSTSNLLDPFDAAKPPSSYCFIVDDCPFELAKPELAHLTPARFGVFNEAIVGSPVRRFVGLPNKDVAPYMNIKRQLDVGKGESGGSDRPLVAIPRQVH